MDVRCGPGKSDRTGAGYNAIQPKGLVGVVTLERRAASTDADGRTGGGCEMRVAVACANDAIINNEVVRIVGAGRGAGRHTGAEDACVGDGDRPGADGRRNLVSERAVAHLESAAADDGATRVIVRHAEEQNCAAADLEQAGSTDDGTAALHG